MTSTTRHSRAEDVREVTARLRSRVENFEQATILLTGARGFLGRHFISLFEQLNAEVLKRPCTVIAVDNLRTSGPFGSTGSSDEHTRFINHDITSVLAVDESIDYVIHAAGIASPFYYKKYPLETIDAATVGTRNILELAVRKRARAVLYFSSSEIYGDPDAAHVPTNEDYNGNVSTLGARACYDESKRLGETLCSVFASSGDIATKIVRPFNVYGPGMQETDYRVVPTFGSKLVRGEPITVYSNGEQTRTFCYITDALVGFVLALIHGRSGEAYNIGNPRPEIAIRDLALLMCELTGRDPLVQTAAYPESYPADEPRRRCPDIRKAELELGYLPTVPLRDGLERFMEWAEVAYLPTL